MAGIWLVSLCGAFALLLPCTLGNETPPLHLSDATTNERLSKIESVLESVLEKNAELEKKNIELELRVESLENENRRLNTDRISTPTEDGTAGEVSGNYMFKSNTGEPTVEAGSSELQDDTVRQPTLINIQKRSSGKRPKALFSGSNTVAFTALLSKPLVANLGAGQTIVYNYVLTNEGGAYHNATGIFTAPLSGVYVFNIDTMLEVGDSQYLGLMVDGHKVANSFTHGAAETHLMTSSRTVTLRVDAGSEVWVSTFDTTSHGNGRLHGNSYSSFSGWIVGFFD